MKCKSIDNCISTSCNNLPSAKSPRKNRTETGDTPAENTPKETIKEPKNVVHGSYNNNNLRKDKSSIDITRTNLKIKNIIPPIVQKRKMRRNRRK